MMPGQRCFRCGGAIYFDAYDGDRYCMSCGSNETAREGVERARAAYAHDSSPTSAGFTRRGASMSGMMLR